MFIYYVGQYEVAIKDFTETIRLEPGNAGAFNNRGFCYESLKQYDMAIKDFTETIRLNPNDVHAFYSRAGCYARLGKMDAAGEDIARARELGGK